jgi:hypothetical protein
MHGSEEMTFCDIGVAFGCSGRTALRRWHDAVLRLNQVLDPRQESTGATISPHRG